MLYGNIRRFKYYELIKNVTFKHVLFKIYIYMYTHNANIKLKQILFNNLHEFRFFLIS